MKPAPKANPRQLLTALEIAEILAVPREKVYDLMRDGGVPCLRIGRRVRYRAGEFDRWLSAREQ